MNQWVLIKKVNDYRSDQRIVHLRQALEDVSILAHLDGYRPEHLVFVDQVLKVLGELALAQSLPDLLSSQGLPWP